jgi:hypothetical protein
MEHDVPDEIEPTPEEERRMLAEINTDTATALRVARALALSDRPAFKREVDEIAASQRTMYVLVPLATMTARLGAALMQRHGGEVVDWLDSAALDVLDQVAEEHDRLGDGTEK